MEKPIKTLSSQIVWESRWYRVRRDTIQLADGRLGEYNVVEMPPSVFVVPIHENGKVLLIRTYRHTLQEWTWEVPAGGIKAGQSPEEAAAAELHEEIGGQAQTLHFLIRCSTMNGIGEHYTHVYLARGVQLAEAEREDFEFMTVHQLSVAEAMDLARSGAMNDALSVMALLVAEPLLR